MKRWTLRGKINILIIIVLIPFLIIQFDGIISRYERAVQVELRSNQEFAQAIRSTLMNYFKNMWDIEYAIGTALLAGEKPLSVEEMEAYLTDILPKYPILRGIVCIDPRGKVIASIPPAMQGLSLADREYYYKLLEGQEAYVANIMESTHIEGTLKAFLPISRAIYRDGELVGIIGIGLDVRKFDQVLGVELHSRLASFGFVDRNGMIVYRYGSSDIAMEARKISPTSPAHPALKGETVLSRKFYSSITKEERMGAVLPIPEIGWAVFATSSVDEVLADAKAMAWRDALVLLIAIIISIMAALILSNHFLRPLMALQHAALSIAEGELNARTMIAGSDELATTGRIFDEMAERIQQLEVSRSRFLQTAAHELRNPMAGIKGMLALIRRRVSQGKPLSEIVPMFQIMEREIDRLSELLNQILEAFRSQRENGLLILKLQRFNLTDLVENTLRPFQHVESRCNFILEKKDGESIWITGDILRIEEVLRNLLSNAEKYSPNGGMVIVTLKTEGERVFLSVKDQGIGIPKEQLKDIFKCFHRAQNMQQDDPGGMGLGLYICNEIVHKHGGEIWVESVEGVGSTFYVQLPREVDGVSLAQGETIITIGQSQHNINNTRNNSGECIENIAKG